MIYRENIIYNTDLHNIIRGPFCWKCHIVWKDYPEAFSMFSVLFLSLKPQRGGIRRIFYYGESISYSMYYKYAYFPFDFWCHSFWNFKTTFVLLLRTKLLPILSPNRKQSLFLFHLSSFDAGSVGLFACVRYVCTTL
jgi:hypothetical protein